jgi:uncharacterized protein
MEYRLLGRTGWRVSAISVGTEYLLGASVDHVTRVIHEALDCGVNYFDVFWAQPEFRDTMGVAFRGRRREAMLAGHLGASVDANGQGSRTRDPEVARGYIEDFLRRYHTDYIDVLHLHNIDPQEDYDRVMQGGLLDLALRYKQEGVARAIGFSGHTVSTALQAVESGHVDVIMFPINMAGHAIPGKRRLLEACARHDVGLVAMKPYAGGSLFMRERTITVEDFRAGGAVVTLEKKVPITPVQCLAYVLAQTGVSTMVPGVKDVAQLAAAQAYWEATEEERDYSEVLASFQQYAEGECVYCNHCLPCPAVIDIGQVNRLLDLAEHGLGDDLRAAYDALEANADDCIQCGSCEERCPFGVQVIAHMERAAEVFAG